MSQNNNKKLLGQIYTPDFVVQKMLNDIHFNNKNILNKKILDPACGDGRFLLEIAKIIIYFSPLVDLKYNLEQIYGWDIDPQAVELCIYNLNQLVKSYQLDINWNITIKNALYVNNTLLFDYIIANPPYIRIQNLLIKDRNYIQNRYNFCKNGSTDIYIAFYELTIQLLNKEGIAAFISPNSFFYTQTAAILRNYFTENANIVQISNYNHIQIFDNVSTYTTIFIFNKKIQNNFIYEQAISKNEFIKYQIDINQLKKTNVWSFFIDNTNEINGQPLKNIADVHVGLTTLCDKAYIFEYVSTENDYIWVKTALKGLQKIEKQLLKPIVKASKLKNSEQIISQYILFPYYLSTNKKHMIISEEILKNNYPQAYNYLLSVKNELDLRDKGKKNAVAWYAFGRSQGLDSSFGNKILFSPISKKPNFILYDKNPEACFYSGYCIKYKGDYQYLLSQLNSKRLENFINNRSRDFRGGWKAYSKSVLADFLIEEQEPRKNNSVQSQLF